LRDDGIRVNLHFNCTQCAKCCRHTKVPLTVAEAIDWLDDGHDVQVICEATPWMPADAARADYLVARSFAARSGALPMRVAVTLVANIAGDCPNLLADLRCGIYERRPLICRIYPAETNPFIQLEPQKKSCPPEAWAPGQPLLQRDERIASKVIRNNIRRWRERNTRDVSAKVQLCAALNLITASVAQEGFFIYSPQIGVLHDVLRHVGVAGEATASDVQWTLVSDREETLQRLIQAGAIASHPRHMRAGQYEFIGLER
jgi:Fe-S-cluster containining protein